MMLPAVRRGALLAVLAATTLAHARAQGPPDTSATARALAPAILAFFGEWNAAWRASEADRHPLDYLHTGSRPPYSRTALLHCHTRDADWHASRNQFYANGIESRHSAIAVCPSWFAAPTFRDLADEGVRIDHALSSARAAPIVAARAELIARLDSAWRTSPPSDWLVGQLVRFLVDQGQDDRALETARQCQSSQW